MSKGFQPMRAASLAKNSFFGNLVGPVSSWYVNAAGYRKMGLRADDLIIEESDVVQLALKRLPKNEAYDRVFRLRRAFQCSLAHQLLPSHEQTKPEEDYPYLSPIIAEIEAEIKERENLDAMVVERKS